MVERVWPLRRPTPPGIVTTRQVGTLQHGSPHPIAAIECERALELPRWRAASWKAPPFTFQGTKPTALHRAFGSRTCPLRTTVCTERRALMFPSGRPSTRTRSAILPSRRLADVDTSVPCQCRRAAIAGATVAAQSKRTTRHGWRSDCAAISEPSRSNGWFDQQSGCVISAV